LGMCEIVAGGVARGRLWSVVAADSRCA